MILQKTEEQKYSKFKRLSLESHFNYYFTEYRRTKIFNQIQKASFDWHSGFRKSFFLTDHDLRHRVLGLYMSKIVKNLPKAPQNISLES